VAQLNLCTRKGELSGTLSMEVFPETGVIQTRYKPYPEDLSEEINYSVNVYELQEGEAGYRQIATAFMRIDEITELNFNSSFYSLDDQKPHSATLSLGLFNFKIFINKNYRASTVLLHAYVEEKGTKSLFRGFMGSFTLDDAKEFGKALSDEISLLDF
jgi:hypothetical protein